MSDYCRRLFTDYPNKIYKRKSFSTLLYLVLLLIFLLLTFRPYTHRILWTNVYSTVKAIVNDILVSAPPPASEITPARILSLLSLLSHYFSFLNILSLFKQRNCYSELGM